MYVQMRLRRYDCADCGTPCKSTSPNAERCRACAKPRLNKQSRDYLQKVLARKRGARQNTAIRNLTASA